MKRLILGSDEVREVLAQVVRERTEQYKHHYQLLPNEDKIYKEVFKDANKVVERIMS
jgi:glycerol-3-phosphate O-acyltransferase